MMDREELIIFYFSLGYSYKRILNFLSLHGVSLSMRQLKRKLKKLHLGRRGTQISIENTIAAIQVSLSDVSLCSL